MAESHTFIPVTKLKGRENYTTWKIAMENLLSLDGLWKSVLGTEMNAEKIAKAKAKIVLSVEETLYIHVANATTAEEAWKNLHKAFEDTGLTRKVGLLRKITTTRLENCESMEKYVNEVMSAAHQLTAIGFEINQEWLGTALLAGLPEQYQPMIMALENSGMAITGDSVKTKLLQESSCFDKSKSKANNDTAYNVKKYTKGAKPKPWQKDAKCYACGKQGHISYNCSDKKRDIKDNKDKKRECEKKKNETKVAFIAGDSTATSGTGWIIDSAASGHMSPNKELFNSLVTLSESEVIVANNKRLSVEGKGTITVSVLINDNVREITVHDVLYVPELGVNLLSVRKITERGYVVEFRKNVCKITDTDGDLVAVARTKNNIYKLIQPVNTAYNCTVWHRRLGHLNKVSMKLLRDKHACGLKFGDPDEHQCKICVQGKQRRQPFSSKTRNERRTSKPLELVHSDICGPMEEVSIGGSKYFILFIDDYSRRLSIYFLEKKSEALDAFKTYKAYVERKLGHNIQALRSDNGREYVSGAFEQFLKEEGIQHQLTIPYTPQQNGLAERCNRTVVEKARCLLIDADLPKKFWAEACSTAVYLINRSPAKGLSGQTPHEIWSGKKPDLSHLKVFGCRALAHIPKEQRCKWDKKAKPCLLLGYLEHTQGYRLYDTEAKKVFRCRDVVFYENETNYRIEPVNDSKEDDDSDSVGDCADDTEESFNTPVNEISSEREDANEEIIELSDEDPTQRTGLEGDEPEQQLRRSSRIPKPKNWLDYISFKVESTSTEPSSVHEALNGSHSKEWSLAMKEEFDALTQNKTWKLCSPPREKKILKTRWVFKIKDNPQDGSQKFKARLVAKGYEQIPGVDYHETFCPVVRFSTLRSLLAIGAREDYDIDHLDVVTAFLNGDLDEEVYIQQPEGFVDKGQKKKVCKLKKALYGLKQGAYAWNKKLEETLQELKFIRSEVDHGLYTRKEKDGRVAYVTTYVDDLLLFTNNQELKQSIIKKLEGKFKVRNLGPVSRVLGINVYRNRSKREITLDQKDYIENVLKRFNMENCKPVKTPLDPNQILTKEMAPEEDTEISEMKNVPYKEALGSLMYAYLVTRMDLGCAVSTLGAFAENPGKTHWNALKRVLRYIKGTKDFKLTFNNSGKAKLVGYSDANWAGNVDDRRSTSGYVFLLGNSAISWCSKRQQTVSLSTTESEYIAITLACQELLWLKGLLKDIDNSYVETPIKLFSDNQSAIKLVYSNNYHARSKHIDTKYNFVKENVANKVIDLSYVPTEEMIADALTKPVTSNINSYCNEGIGLRE